MARQPEWKWQAFPGEPLRRVKPLHTEVGRCRKCGYVIEGMPAGACPECGARFDPADVRSYVRRAPKDVWKLWAPGLALSLAVGLTLMLTIGLIAGNWGWPMWIAPPFAASVLLGYRAHVRWWWLPVLGLALALGLIVGLMSVGLAGVYCALVLLAIFAIPILIGAGLGAALRNTLKAMEFSQRSNLPVALIVGGPLLCAALNGRSGPHSLEIVQTSRTIGATPAQTWNAMQFYEEVKHPAPFILRIGLVRPLRTEGSARAPNDVKVCVYNKGRITKVVRGAASARSLSFDVTEQRIGYERDFRLVDGSFEFAPADNSSTRVTLTTRYKPKLGPRFCWRPFERFAVHMLHGHVLEGMRRSAEGEPHNDGARVSLGSDGGGALAQPTP